MNQICSKHVNLLTHRSKGFLTLHLVCGEGWGGGTVGVGGGGRRGFALVCKFVSILICFIYKM